MYSSPSPSLLWRAQLFTVRETHPSDLCLRGVFHFRDPCGSRGWRNRGHLPRDSSDSLSASDLADVRGAGNNSRPQSPPSCCHNSIARLADGACSCLCRSYPRACEKQIELTENLAVPAYGPHASCSPDTRAVSSTALNNLHGSWFGKRIAQRNV